jgi:hypothetical protein
MKQTVVDWLEDNLIGNPFNEKDFAHNVNIFKKAKDMEKKQIEDAYDSGMVWGYDLGFTKDNSTGQTGKIFYKEKYGKK